jgi:hypothetical protein
MCGGVVTEPGYFNGLRQATRNPAVRVCVKKKGIDPTSLVDHAAAIRELDPDAFDEIWCVIDVDQFNLPDAIAVASNRGVRLAISNPCFEIWLLLHCADCTAPVGNPAEAVRRLKRHIPGYSKQELRFETFAPGVAEAIERARGLGPHGEEHLRNPSTGVWVVAQTIVGNA